MQVTNKLFLKFWSVSLLLMFNTNLFAQLNSGFNTYSYDLMQVNVASMGSSCFEANLNYRAALINLNNGPKLYQLNSYLRLGDKQAVGLKAYQSSVGLTQFNTITGAYAYRLKLKEEASLNFGMGVSYYQVGFSAHKAIVTDQDDPNLENDGTTLRGNNFDCEMGAEYKYKTLKIGLSVNHLYNTNKNVGATQFKTLQEFNLYTTYNFKLGPNLELMPWLLTRYNLGGAFLPEAMVNTRYKKMFSVGVGYRYSNALITNLAAEMKGFKIVYSFDYNFNQISKVLGTSHQILLGFDLCQKKSKEASIE